MKKYNILVTGLNGYIASNLIKKLLSDGNHVVALTTKQSSLENNFHKNLKIHLYNGTFSSVNYAFQNKKINLVFHVASATSYYHEIEDIELAIDCNIKYASYLMEAMSQNDCNHLINTGTHWQYNSSGKVESICFYAATKQAFENIIDYYVFDKKLSVITLNLPDIYGVNDNRGKIFSSIKKSYKNNSAINLTDGNQLMDFLYIDDVIDGYIASMKIVQNKSHNQKHKKYFLTGGNLKSLKEVVLKYLEITGWGVVINWGVLNHRKNQIMKPYVGKVLPNWKAKFELETGLKIIAHEK